MTEQNSGNSTVEELERYFEEEESAAAAAAAHILQIQQEETPLDNINESLSTITTMTPNPLDIAFVNETSDSEQSQNGVFQQQSQTTRVVSSLVDGLIDTISTKREPTMISIGTMAKTPIKMKSTGTLPITPKATKSTGTMPKTPIATKSTGTVPKTPTATKSIGTMPKTPTTGST
ncbi:unnamed protein product [Adineta steineri]|uniref:Uncharacterized protein n=1 Tax=Adineta steineri TaxID=433720 RepID=A0A816C5A1_9BILA|nr:unnamed protein product [Adineta steineri]CAF1481638.1 unnamed protein product [Adineta steineri]CAF1618508.1 unnamed protein product [Adineta steineri]CAF1618544.1 unnamed protein product [Adineta steineri]